MYVYVVYVYVYTILADAIVAVFHYSFIVCYTCSYKILIGMHEMHGRMHPN